MIHDAKVVFRGIDHSTAVEEAVLKRLQKLERYSEELQSLRVILEVPHKNRQKGQVYHVSIEVVLPNHDIVVSREQHDKHEHEDLYVAIRDAFNALERRIKAVYAKRRRANRAGGKLGHRLMTAAMDEISPSMEAANQ